jgi:hypothetical protein
MIRLKNGTDLVFIASKRESKLIAAVHNKKLK